MTKVKLSILKGGPSSGNFDHAGRPGKVGGSAPGKGGKGKSKLKPKAATSSFAQQAKSGDYKGKGKKLAQGMQAKTRKVIMKDGTLAVEKVYIKEYEEAGIDLALNDVVTYEIAQATGIDGVPEVVKTGDNKSIQEFVPGSDFWYEYYGWKSGREKDPKKISDAVMYDVLIGNMDRFGGNGNLLVNMKTGQVSLIDNSFSLAGTPPYITKLGYDGFIKQKVSNAGRFFTVVSGGVTTKEWSPVGSISKSQWSTFVTKARSTKVKSIIMSNYGDTVGNQVYKDMMGRVDAFDKLYASKLED